MRFKAQRAFTAIFFLICSGVSAWAAPYAAFVMDARTGQVLYSRNADTRLHPASLTKMMTLYIVFDAVERGEISLDKKVRISRYAANRPPSKLGLRAGQRISIRYLIRAAAVKSANDAASALAEAISGSEKAFARRMNATAKKLGMKNTTFRNPHGLTVRGHLSTARDMSLLGRRLFYDFPQYYNLFSRKTTDAGVRKVRNTNRKLLAAYRGADGIKTGYTNAAGFNLVASAHRGNERIIATVFGGKTAAWRNAKVAELLDMGFRKSPSYAAVIKPAPVDISVKPKVIKVAVSGVVSKSLFPKARETAPTLVAEADAKTIEKLIVAANQKVQVAAVVTARGEIQKVRPKLREQKAVSRELRVVTRVSTSGRRLWAVQVGAYRTRKLAEKALLQTALREVQTLENSERRIDYTLVQGNMRYRARFVGLNQAEANMTCARLQARNASCASIKPGV